MKSKYEYLREKVNALQDELNHAFTRIKYLESISHINDKLIDYIQDEMINKKKREIAEAIDYCDELQADTKPKFPGEFSKLLGEYKRKRGIK